MVAGAMSIAALVLVASLIRRSDVAQIEEQVDVPESVPDEEPVYEAA